MCLSYFLWYMDLNEVGRVGLLSHQLFWLSISFITTFFHASFSYGGEISMKAKVNNSTTITTHQNIPQQRLKSILSSRILFSISLLFESVIGNNKLKKRKLSFTTMIFRASSLDLRAKILNLQFDLSWYKQTKEIGSRSDTLPRMEKEISSWNNRSF